MPSNFEDSSDNPPFIDIHTHRRDTTSGVISIANFSQNDIKNGAYTEGSFDFGFEMPDFGVFPKSDISNPKYTKASPLASVGLHPWFLTKENFKKDFEMLSQLVHNQDVMTIGECGLDSMKGEDLAFQTMAFEAQIRLAESVSKPVVIHCVRAFGEIVALKKRLKPTVPMLIHGFNKKQTVLTELLRHGFFISIGASILPKNGVSRFSGCQNVPYTEGSPSSEILRKIPLDRLFFETDDAENVDISDVYNTAAKVLKMDLNDLKSTIYKSFSALSSNFRFGFKHH
jgi:TatD DNase family protein